MFEESLVEFISEILKATGYPIAKKLRPDRATDPEGRENVVLGCMFWLFFGGGFVVLALLIVEYVRAGAFSYVATCRTGLIQTADHGRWNGWPRMGTIHG